MSCSTRLAEPSNWSPHSARGVRNRSDCTNITRKQENLDHDYRKKGRSAICVISDLVNLPVITLTRPSPLGVVGGVLEIFVGSLSVSTRRLLWPLRPPDTLTLESSMGGRFGAADLTAHVTRINVTTSVKVRCKIIAVVTPPTAAVIGPLLCPVRAIVLSPARIRASAAMLPLDARPLHPAGHASPVFAPDCNGPPDNFR